jgi:hypothetical protein
MPGYQGNGLATLIRDNQQKFLWNNEPAPVGVLSAAFQLERINRTFYPWGAAFDVQFSGAPGVFEVDIVGAQDDVGFPNPGQYVVLGTITAVNSANCGRWDMPSNMWPKFVAAIIKTLTNASVNTTLRVTR